MMSHYKREVKRRGEKVRGDDVSLHEGGRDRREGSWRG